MINDTGLTDKSSLLPSIRILFLIRLKLLWEMEVRSVRFSRDCKEECRARSNKQKRNKKGNKKGKKMDSALKNGQSMDGELATPLTFSFPSHRHFWCDGFLRGIEKRRTTRSAHDDCWKQKVVVFNAGTVLRAVGNYGGFCGSGPEAFSVSTCNFTICSSSLWGETLADRLGSFEPTLPAKPWRFHSQYINDVGCSCSTD